MKIEENILLSNFTTFKTGGPARFFVRVRTVDDLKEALKYADKNKHKIFILGGGSNILVSDKGFDGLVIKMEIKGIEWVEVAPTPRKARVGVPTTLEACVGIVGAGENWDDLVGQTVGHGLYGLENLSGIPGTVGAAPVQNIGAYGAEVKDTISWVESVDRRTREVKKFSSNECKFGYRDSFFKSAEGKNYIITRVGFRLDKKGKVNITYKDLVSRFADKVPSIKELREEVIAIRKSKLPDLKTYGTAGSFFKNPIISKEKYQELSQKFLGLPSYPWNETHVKIPLAWVLDNICKIKGERRGDVGFYKNQPLAIVNLGNAKASEIDQVANEITKMVKDLTGIEIEREVESIY